MSSLSVCWNGDKCAGLRMCLCAACIFFPLMRDVFVTVCVCMKGILTDAGAEVSILSVDPVVVGVAVVAAHCLQLDLLDLHGLCDGCVGSCCRRCCQAWREEAEETVRLQTATCLLWLSHCTCETFQKASLANKKMKEKENRGQTFEIIKQWIILYTMGNKLLRDHDFVFHLLTGDIFTAGYHADEMDPRVCGSIWFLWMFQRLWHSSPLCIDVFVPWWKKMQSR